MKLVQKIELSGKVHGVVVPAGCDFIHVGIELGKISVFMQSELTTDYNQDLAFVRIGVYEAGEAIPDEAEYVSTVTDEDFQVWHIYVLSIDYLSDDEDENCGCDGVAISNA